MPTDKNVPQARSSLGFDSQGVTSADVTTREPPDSASGIPGYLRRVYSWAYLSPLGQRILDRHIIVTSILWGNIDRLIQAACEEVTPGSSVLQTACVYGNFSAILASKIGPEGYLEVIDVAPIQVNSCRAKLKDYPYAVVRVRDAAEPSDRSYDTVCCFFLLHEVPESYKARIVRSVLDSVEVGGKVVFVDYHRPSPLHPLRPFMLGVFMTLEPFALPLWRNEIASYAEDRERFDWQKQTFFGGLYQKTVARRIA